MTSIRFKVLFTVLVLSLGLWFILSQNLFSELLAVWRQLPWWIVPVAIAIELIATLLNSFKWRLFLPEQRLLNLFKVNLVSQYYALTLSGQMVSEAAKTLYLGRRNPLDWSRIASSVVVDKINGFLGGVIVVGLVGLSFSDFDFSGHIRLILISFFLLGGLVFILFYISASYIRPRENFLLQYSMPSYLRRVAKILEDLVHKGKEHIKAPSRFVLAIACAIGYQMLTVVLIMIISQYIGFELAIFDWAWIISLLSLALVLPLTIAGLGVREGTLVGLLGLFGVSPVAALGLSLSLFSLQVFLATMGGLIQLRDIYKH